MISLPTTLRLSLPVGLVAIGLNAADEANRKTASDVVNVDVPMIFWTWVVFVVLALLLHRFGFKPILEALDKREATIRSGMEAAEKARAEMARIEEVRARLVQEAEDQAKQIIDDGRKAAREAARLIEEKAKSEAQILVQNAQREIRSATESARASLQRESGELAVKLASRILAENLDDERNRALVDKLIGEV